MSLDDVVPERSEAQMCGSKTVADAADQTVKEGLYLQGILVGERLSITVERISP